MTYPWMSTINESVPGSQLLYDRLVTIARNSTVAGPAGSDDIGNVGYSGAEQGTGVEGEVVLFTGLAANIQLRAGGRTIKGGLPTDSVTKPVWVIYIPSTVISRYDVRDRDIVIDDEGYRYEVGANEWSLLGYRLSAIREEA